LVILTIIVQNHEASAYRALIFSGRLQPWHRNKRGRSYPLWVMCGRRLIDKSFFTLMQHWSGTVMCPAC